MDGLGIRDSVDIEVLQDGTNRVDITIFLELGYYGRGK